ncbi:unnamed protein product [Arctogadus glacialis]
MEAQSQAHVFIFTARRLERGSGREIHSSSRESASTPRLREASQSDAEIIKLCKFRKCIEVPVEGERADECFALDASGLVAIGPYFYTQPYLTYTALV